MTYHVEFSKSVLKELEKIDRGTAAMILGWVRKNLEDCENPRVHGKELTANRSGQWRYCIGDYRLIAEIQEERIVILILPIGHRSELYH